MSVVRLMCAGLIVMAILCSGSASPAADAEAATIPVPSTAYVQLNALMAPVVSKSDGRQLGSAAVITVLETGSLENVSAICTNSPRLLDALVQALHEKPIDIGADRHFDFGNLETDVLGRLNTALGGSRLVNRVHLVSGSRSADNNILDKLPFSSVLGCRGAEKDKEKGNGNGKGKTPAKGGAH